MNQLSSVSIVIPNYNYGKFIAKTIESVLAQTYPVSEIIVVDDGSTDNSLEVLEQFGNKIKIIEQQKQGVSAARNAGVKNSSGEFIAFLDADDIWLPNKIEEQIKSFADEEVGLVSCGMREFDTVTGETKYIFGQIKGGVSAKDILLFKTPLVFSGSAIMVRRKVFDGCNGFDERLHISEDWDLCYRIARSKKVAFIPKPLVDYRNHGNNVHLKISKMEHFTFLAYERIFSEADEEILMIRHKCYGSIYKILANSYLRSGDYKAFLKNTFMGLWYDPQNIIYYLKFPIRYISR